MAGIKGPLASVVAWVLGAVTAVGVGLIALTMVGGGFSHDPVQPLSADTVVAPGGAATAPVTATSTSATASSSSTHPAPGQNPATFGMQKLLTSRGGTVVARCRADGNVYLVFWSPAQGYQVGDVVRGPAPETRVEFHGQNVEVKVTVTCVSSTPHADIHEEADGPSDN